jgi:menaquinone-dependent protoporphyrinogen IX oxidase
MKIEYFHASKYGNGAKVAEEFQRQMAVKGVIVAIQHVKKAQP